MSYLSGPELKGFKQAVISLWFKVPQASIDAAMRAANSDDFDSRIPLTTGGVIPLVTFGQIFDDAYGIITTIDGSNSYTSNSWLVFNLCEQLLLGSSQISYNNIKQSKGSTYTLDPGHIGIDCTGTSTNPPTLRVYLQTENYASMSKVPGESSSTFGTADYLHEGSYVFDIDGNLCGSVEQQKLTYASGDTYVLEGKVWESQTTFYDGTDLFVNSSREAFGGSSNISITPDAWHHLLVSFDISGKVTATGGENPKISSSCKMWIALDDKNYDGTDLPLAGYPGFLGPNDIYTQKALNTTTDSGMPPPLNRTVVEVGLVNHSVLESPGGPPTYSLSSTSIPTGLVGLPATNDLKNVVRNVQMAEFLLFTDVTLDTSVEKNRRLFITAEGKPVNPSPITIPVSTLAVGDPATWKPGADWPAFIFEPDPSSVPTSNKILGTAAVDFTKCSLNWMMGRNLGKAKGKFVRTGKVKVYFPDPKLGG
jgi:hypothetical protein